MFKLKIFNSYVFCLRRRLHAVNLLLHETDNAMKMCCRDAETCEVTMTDEEEDQDTSSCEESGDESNDEEESDGDTSNDESDDEDESSDECHGDLNNVGRVHTESLAEPAEDSDDSQPWYVRLRVGHSAGPTQPDRPLPSAPPDPLPTTQPSAPPATAHNVTSTDPYVPTQAPPIGSFVGSHTLDVTPASCEVINETGVQESHRDEEAPGLDTPCEGGHGDVNDSHTLMPSPVVYPSVPFVEADAIPLHSPTQNHESAVPVINTQSEPMDSDPDEPWYVRLRSGHSAGPRPSDPLLSSPPDASAPPEISTYSASIPYAPPLTSYPLAPSSAGTTYPFATSGPVGPFTQHGHNTQAPPIGIFGESHTVDVPNVAPPSYELATGTRVQQFQRDLPPTANQNQSEV